MIQLSKLRVATRLNLGFGLIAAVALLIAVLSTLSLRELSKDLDIIGDDRMTKVDQFFEVETNLRDISRHVRNAMLTRDESDRKAEIARITELRAANVRILAELDKTVVLPEGRALMRTINEVRPVYAQLIDRVLALDAAGNEAGAYALLSGETLEKQNQLFKAVEDSSDMQFELARSLAHEGEQIALSTSWMLAGLTLFALLFSVVIAWAITRSVSRALGAEPAEVGDAVQRVTRGDLSQTLRVRSGDDTSVMACLRKMQASLAGIVGTVRSNADSVATASAQIAQGNADLSQRTEEQASALQQTAATMEELGTTVRQNADNARQANQLARSASEVATRGGDVVGRVVDTMKGISDSSNRIAEIIGTIDGIAFQTNILALNAAVEAARAGEQGRGFAVVAGEVRSLAQRSAQAAKEVKHLIDTSSERVEQGTALVDEAGRTMNEVVSSIRRVTDIVGEISAASSEQSTGVSQVGEAVTQMDQVTQQNAALVEQSAAAAESLKSQAQTLVKTVSVFQLGNGHAPVAAAADPLPAPARPAAHPATAGSAWNGGERRSPQRATNVTRPAFGAPKKADVPKPEPVAVPAPSAKTGTDDQDWTSF